MAPGEALATRFTIGDFDVSYLYHEHFLHLLTYRTISYLTFREICLHCRKLLLWGIWNQKVEVYLWFMGFHVALEISRFYIILCLFIFILNHLFVLR